MGSLLPDDMAGELARRAPRDQCRLRMTGREAARGIGCDPMLRPMSARKTATIRLTAKPLRHLERRRESRYLGNKANGEYAVKPRNCRNSQGRAGAALPCFRHPHPLSGAV